MSWYVRSSAVKSGNVRLVSAVTIPTTASFGKVRISALDKNGREIRVTAEGFLARVFQHEIDHTNGIVFIDHIKDKPEAFFKLSDDGKLEKLDYEKDVRDNKDLW